jgi:hypothetical protein
MWAQGSGIVYHGVGKVHVMGENGRTLCNRQPKWFNAWRPSGNDAEVHGECAVCARRGA